MDSTTQKSTQSLITMTTSKFQGRIPPEQQFSKCDLGISRSLSCILWGEGTKSNHFHNIKMLFAFSPSLLNECFLEATRDGTLQQTEREAMPLFTFLFRSYYSTYMWYLKQSHLQMERMVVARREEQGIQLEKMKKFWGWLVVMVAQCTRTSCPRTVHLKQ